MKNENIARKQLRDLVLELGLKNVAKQFKIDQLSIARFCANFPGVRRGTVALIEQGLNEKPAPKATSKVAARIRRGKSREAVATA